jgi:hypothetical protein
LIVIGSFKGSGEKEWLDIIFVIKKSTKAMHDREVSSF